MVVWVEDLLCTCTFSYLGRLCIMHLFISMSAVLQIYIQCTFVLTMLTILGWPRPVGWGGGSVGSVDPPPLVRTSSACHQNNLFITSIHVHL